MTIVLGIVVAVVALVPLYVDAVRNRKRYMALVEAFPRLRDPAAITERIERDGARIIVFGQLDAWTMIYLPRRASLARASTAGLPACRELRTFVDGVSYVKTVRVDGVCVPRAEFERLWNAREDRRDVS